MNVFKCDVCGQNKTNEDKFTTGYGLTHDNRIICYTCCGEVDAQEMQKTGKATLYFTGTEVTNWPGSLRFSVEGVVKSRHNMAQFRYDFWFNAFGMEWHGYKIGDNTQIAHCKQTNRKAS